MVAPGWLEITIPLIVSGFKMINCSGYVPGHTFMTLPAGAAAIAAEIVV